MKITKKLLKEMIEEELAAINGPRRAWYEEDEQVQRAKRSWVLREPKDTAAALHGLMNDVVCREDTKLKLVWGLILALKERLRAEPEAEPEVEPVIPPGEDGGSTP